jgi:hypothetical protein
MTLGGTSFVYHLDTDGSSSLKLPTGWTPRPRDADWETAALIDGDAGTLVLGGDITLEAYARPGEQLTHACTRFVVVSSGGTSRVIAR